MEPRHILAGNFDVSYSVTRLGQTAEPSEVMKVFLSSPAPVVMMTTKNRATKLIMHIPREILDGGIDKDNVAAGVDIRIDLTRTFSPVT
jgi:hypothetical protein